MNDLQARREAIDHIDQQIINLIAQRKKEVEGIIAIKQQSGMQAHQPARFAEVLERCRKQAEANQVDPDVVERIWHILHEYFLRLENEALTA